MLLHKLELPIIETSYHKHMHNNVSHAAPDVAPSNVRADVLGSTALNISWEEIPPINRNGIVIAYEVLYEPLETFEGRLMPMQVNTSDLYVVLNSLEEFVGYNVSIRAYTSVGPGPYSNKVFAMTQEASKWSLYII